MICRDCRIDKPRSAYRTTNRSRLGIERVCLKCVMAKQKTRQRAGRDGDPSPSEIEAMKREFNRNTSTLARGRQMNGGNPILREDTSNVKHAIAASCGNVWTEADEDAVFATRDRYVEGEAILDVDGQECKR